MYCYCSLIYSIDFRKYLFACACSDVLGSMYANSSHITIYDILDGSEHLYEIYPKILNYLYEWCSYDGIHLNFFGEHLYKECCDVYNRLLSFYVTLFV